MGIRYRSLCPDILEDHINEWVFIYTTNDTGAFFDVQWQIIEVGDNYVLFRRPVADLDGFQYAVFMCHEIVAVVQAPPA